MNGYFSDFDRFKVFILRFPLTVKNSEISILFISNRQHNQNQGVSAMKIILQLCVISWLLSSVSGFASCIGYSGPGGPCSTGPGGGLSTGPGGGAYTGPGGGAYIGPGGGAYTGPGGGAYTGPGGGAYTGPGGGAYTGPGGGAYTGPGGGAYTGPGGGCYAGPGGGGSDQWNRPNPNCK